MEQRTRELRKEGELLHKNLEEQMCLNREEERSCQVGELVLGSKWWQWVVALCHPAHCSEVTLPGTQWQFHSVSHHCAEQ